jgi:hypothetical protein
MITVLRSWQGIGSRIYGGIDCRPHQEVGMKRTFAFVIGCAALASAALPALPSATAPGASNRGWPKNIRRVGSLSDLAAEKIAHDYVPPIVFVHDCIYDLISWQGAKP